MELKLKKDYPKKDGQQLKYVNKERLTNFYGECVKKRKNRPNKKMAEVL